MIKAPAAFHTSEGRVRSLFRALVAQSLGHFDSGERQLNQFGSGISLTVGQFASPFLIRSATSLCQLTRPCGQT